MVGGGVFCKKLSIKHFSVFQGEVAAIKVVLDILLRSAAIFREVSIHSSSRAPIPALSSLTVHLKRV